MKYQREIQEKNLKKGNNEDRRKQKKCKRKKRSKQTRQQQGKEKSELAAHVDENVMVAL